GMFYKFQLQDGLFPDPASRFQPEGPHGASEIVDSGLFKWADTRWPGVRRQGQVIYEMHVGTFTPEGTWAGAMEQLPELAELGITVIELMPVAEFPGRFGWGYDGVDLFAPTHLYGIPDEFRAFVDRAHQLGIGVILDVVYNHLGPDGNYLKHFSEHYFTDRYQNEWGEPINFDGEHCSPVREFFITNAAYWIEEFHLDGLRLDATQQIFDASPNHILGALSRRVREAGKGRATYLVGENEPQHTKLVRPFEAGGYGLDALWNDDFHHSAMVALTGRNEAYYCDYRGTPQEFISAMKWGYLYQGQWYSWQQKRRGTPSFDLLPEQFVNYLQNHDQVANSLHGMRLHQMASAGRVRALTALLLLGPGTPMLFQGQEFAASSPFLYFADHHPELAGLVAKGRREFLQQFPSIACPESDAYIAQPDSVETFHRSKLDLAERQKHKHFYDLHRDLLRLRREGPVFSRPRPGQVDGAVLGPEAFALRFFGDKGQDRLLLVNLGVDVHLHPAPEPLLAPVEGTCWAVEWSSESPRYGGCGTPPLENEGNWRILGQAVVVLGPASLETEH
ncbi:MAG TPA: malto-oligosyltrehalose trehalohydrolase, partial [Bacillota bacterium]|nr:malto-oligosyltrehalose trehalohydrolase [Bacillota bacterium]